MDVPTLNTFLSPMFTFTTVWNTGETGDINKTEKTVFINISKIIYHLDTRHPYVIQACPVFGWLPYFKKYHKEIQKIRHTSRRVMFDEICMTPFMNAPLPVGYCFGGGVVSTFVILDLRMLVK